MKYYFIKQDINNDIIWEAGTVTIVYLECIANLR